MGSIRFVSCPMDPKVLPKVFSFDSSPGYAISRAMGDLDPKSYHPILREEKADGTEKVFEIHMARMETECNPGPHPLRKVGTIFWSKPTF
jgi:hypothetical protein